MIANSGFNPMHIGQGGVKLNSMINIQESIIVVQSGEVKLSIKDGNSFQVSKIVNEGQVIYSKLAVINYLLNFKSKFALCYILVGIGVFFLKLFSLLICIFFRQT